MMFFLKTEKVNFKYYENGFAWYQGHFYDIVEIFVWQYFFIENKLSSLVPAILDPPNDNIFLPSISD